MKESQNIRKELYNQKSLAPFVKKELEKMIHMGYTHVQVNGYTADRTLDFVEPRYIILTPIKSITGEDSDSGIYEPIHSELLSQWASMEEGVKVWVSYA